VDSTIVREWEAGDGAAVVEVEVAHMEQEAMARGGSIVEAEVAAAAEEVSMEVKVVNQAQEVTQTEEVNRAQEVGQAQEVSQVRESNQAQEVKQVRKGNESMALQPGASAAYWIRVCKGHIIIGNKTVRDPLSKSSENQKQRVVGACTGSGTDIILCE
jgi:hypothetical protein